MFLLLWLLAAQAVPAFAQNPITTIESLAVDLWPDYDRTAVLVLITGFLPADTPLPATITIPLPKDADIHAVARISDEGDLLSDITYDESVNGEVTLTTTDPRFRVEYYMPYNLDGDTRTFSFEWQAAVDVTELLISVQQPVATDELTTEPAAFSVTPRQDGLQYHNLSPVNVPAGDSFAVSVSYSRAVSQLSAELLQPVSTEEQPAAPAASRLNWQTIVLISGGVAVLAVGIWMIFGERFLAARQAPAKSRPAAAPKRPKVDKREKKEGTAVVETPTNFVQFCHHCGQKSDPNDRFCRSCGTKLKV